MFSLVSVLLFTGESLSHDALGSYPMMQLRGFTPATGRTSHEGPARKDQPGRASQEVSVSPTGRLSCLNATTLTSMGLRYMVKIDVC